MNTRLLFLVGLLLVTAQSFAETTPMARPTASRLAAAKSTYTTIASSSNPSTVGAAVTFTATLKDNDFRSSQIVNEGTVTFSEAATVLAADVPVAAGVASFSTTALTAGTHVITAVYNATANFSTSTGSIAQTVDDPGSCPTYNGNIAYVNASATVGTNNGTSWATAFLTLQAALDAARTCGVTQIWVAQGTYVPTAYPIGAATTQSGGGFSSADFSFHLINGVAIYGGFNGNETLLSQRNWRQNPTILSGSNARNHVVTSANDGLATRLDGFTITGGYANGNNNLFVEGRFFSPRSGGGASLNASSVTLSNLLISGNTCPSTDFSGGQGGGMSMQGGSSVLTNVAFVGNSAYSGGGLDVSSAVTMTNCVFSGNTANSGGGGMISGGNVNTSATLTNVVFANNAATRSAGFSAFGGAIINNGCVTTLVNCTFFGNTAPGTGGTMYSVNGATVTDKNGIYYNNTNNGNTAYNGVFLNRDSSSPFPGPYDSFTPTTTLTGVDPKFVNSADPDGPDNVWMTTDDGLSIQSTSPAINAGTLAGAPVTDIRGFARTGNPDQGAYEYGIYGPTASVLSVTGPSTICRGTTANLKVTITGGTSPYTVVYSDGINNFTKLNYVSGADIAVSPEVTTTYSLVSVTDAASIAGTGNSGTPTITVTDPPTWYLDADGDGYYVSSTQSCTNPGTGYTTTMGSPGDCNDDPNAGGAAIHAPVQYYVDADHDGYGSTSTEMVCSLTATIGYSTNNTDCNDANKDVWQSASLYIDADGDGYDAGQEPVCYGAAIPAGYKATTLGTDCNDSDPGTLVVSVGSACRQVYAGYDAASNSTVLTATASGQGRSGYTYLWSNGATTPSITVSPATTTIYSVTASKLGCSATAAVTVNVINVACEKNKVLVCHNGQTLCIAASAVKAHLDHGDKLGSCDTELPCGSANSRVAAYEPAIEAPTEGWLAYPNPFEQTLTLQLHAATAGSADIVLVDMVGRSVVSRKQLLVEGPNRVVLETGRVAPGVYIVQVTDAASVVRTLKVLKK